MEIDFNSVLKRYQERLSAVMHANVMLECQVEELQTQLAELQPKTNGEANLAPEALAGMAKAES